MKRLVAACALLLATLATASASADYCPAGYPNDCGNGRCCPSGFTCGGSCGGECCGPSSGGGSSSGGGNTSGGNGGRGGGVCPAGYPNDCGNNRCCPSGTTCGGSCGSECCPTGYDDNDDGSSYNGGRTSQTGGDHYLCQSTYAGSGCSTVKACAGPGQAWYEADGRRFNCTGTSCASAADEVAAYCDESSAGSCSSSSVSAKPNTNGAVLAGGLLAGAIILGVARRRRKVA